MRKRIVFLIIIVTIMSLPSLGQSRYAAWYDSIPILDLQYLKEHPLRNTIKSSSPTQVLLHTPPIIGNQENLNSCVGWALCYAGASIRLYDSIPNWDIALCSPSYLFNQYKHSHAAVDTTSCDSVSSNILYLGYWLSKEGTCSYAQMPYTTNCNQMPTIAQKIDALNKRFSINQLPVTNDTSWYKQALRFGWPIVVGMPVYDSFLTMWNDTTSHGEWNNVDTTLYDHNASGHATCIVGYDDEKDAFKVMNSWGDSLGDHGFYWVKYNVVEHGAFRDAVAVMMRDSAQIEGPSYLCDTMYHYVRNVPEGATIQWQLTNPQYAHYSYAVSGPRDRDSVLIVYHIPYAKSDPKIVFPPSPPIYPDSAMTLKVTISSGDNSYLAQKKLYLPSVGVPAISASDTASRWEGHTTRTFTVTNCREVSDNMITWTIKRTRPTSPLFPPYTTIVYQATGRTITYTPTTTGDYEVIATNEAKPCGTNVSSKTYTVSYTIAGTGMEEESSSIDEESVQHLHQRITANSASYTYELWHTIYGRMRTQQVTDINEQIDTAGLPQGAYVLLEKNQNGEIVKQTKIMIQ